MDKSSPVKRQISQMQNKLHIPDIIIKKRDGKELCRSDLFSFVNGVVDGSVQEAQAGAMLMAMTIKGLNDNETEHLTDAMIKTGESLRWPDKWAGKLIDKHSTGGVGDKTSLVLTPALAACGMKVPMISGRGLAHTGGTLDKLESIPGFRCELSSEEMRRAVDKNGCCIVGQTPDIVPADRKMYAIRDVTGTVDSIGLITASILSKKTVETIDALVLDVKCGSGAVNQDERFMKTLAKKMVRTGNRLGIKTIALLTCMKNPIGRMVGNALEVAEAIECLKGRGPEDLTELVSNLGGHLLFKSGNATSVENGIEQIKEKIRGECMALDVFCKIIKEQGVDAADADELCRRDADVWSILPRAENISELRTKSSGYVHEINALICGETSVILGAGRSRGSDQIRYGVGLELLVKVGDYITEDQSWVKVHHDSEFLSEEVSTKLQTALRILPNKPESRARVQELIDDPGNGVL